MMPFDPSTQYVYMYTIALLPNVDEAEFETRMVQEVLPTFAVLRRNIEELRLEHRLLKRATNDRRDLYVLEIQVLTVRTVNEGGEHYALAEMDETIRRELANFGIPISLTILRQIGVIQSPH